MQASTTKNRQALQYYCYLYITILQLVIFYYQSFTINNTCAVLTTSNLLNYSSNLMNSSNLKRETWYMIDCHGAGDNYYKARSFQEIYLNIFVFYFYLFILA